MCLQYVILRWPGRQVHSRTCVSAHSGVNNALLLRIADCCTWIPRDPLQFRSQGGPPGWLPHTSMVSLPATVTPAACPRALDVDSTSPLNTLLGSAHSFKLPTANFCVRACRLTTSGSWQSAGHKSSSYYVQGLERHLVHGCVNRLKTSQDAGQLLDEMEPESRKVGGFQPNELRSLKRVLLPIF